MTYLKLLLNIKIFSVAYRVFLNGGVKRDSNHNQIRLVEKFFQVVAKEEKMIFTLNLSLISQGVSKGWAMAQFPRL